MWANQQSVDRLTATLARFQIRKGAKQKATDIKHLPIPVKMALRTKEVFLGPEKLLHWIMSLVG